MKSKKTVRMTHLKNVEEDVIVELVICNQCGKELNSVSGWAMFDNEDKHRCSMCGEGHWCRDHFIAIETDHASSDNDYEPEYLHICEKCSTLYRDLISQIKILDKVIENAEEKRYILREELVKHKKKRSS